MRILHVTPSVLTSYGGPVSTLRSMLDIWMANGIVADVATCESSAPAERELRARRVMRFEKARPIRFSRSPDFERWLVQCAHYYDLVFVHGIWTLFSNRACSVLLGLKVPYLILPHGSLDPFDLKKKAAIKRVLGPTLIRRALEGASSIVCSTSREAERLVTYGTALPTEIVPWPLRPGAEGNRHRFRQAHSLTETEFVFLFLSRIDYKKGLDILIPAFSRLLRLGCKAKLAIAGSGSAGFELAVRRLVDAYGCYRDIIFTGFLEGFAKADAFAGSDCFLLPSRNENFGHSVAESLAAGLPVVVTREVYIEEVISAHECNWICKYEIDDLQRILVHILNSPEEVARKRRGTRAAAAHFGQKSLTPRYLKLLSVHARPARMGKLVVERVGGQKKSEGSPTQSALDIMHVQGIFAPEHGGPTYSLTNFSVEQARLGHRVKVRVLDGYSDVSGARQLPAAIDRRACQVNFPERLGFSWELSNVLAGDETMDVYHLHGSWLIAMLMGAREASRRKRPYLVEMMGSYTDYELRRKWVRKSFARMLYQDKILQRAACIHVNSEEEGDTLRRRGIKTPIACLPVGVDLSETRRILSQIAVLGRIRPQPYILYLGRIHPTKGIDKLLAAWMAVRQSAADCQLVIAGTGEPGYVAECRRHSAPLVKSGSCEWLGNVTEEEKVRLYRDATAYILPSLNENFGNTVAEALACGTPVITTFNTQWQMLEHRECGWLAEAEVSSLSYALERCLDAGESERRRRGVLGREFVESEYSIETVVSNMVEIYRGMVTGTLPARLLL
jgi:glycosyltransferase involved in cell wall biosynthesis